MAVREARSGRHAFYDRIRDRFTWMDDTGRDVLLPVLRRLEDDGLIIFGTVNNGITVANRPNVRLVHPHSEGRGGDDDVELVLRPAIHDQSPLVGDRLAGEERDPTITAIFRETTVDLVRVLNFGRVYYRGPRDPVDDPVQRLPTRFGRVERLHDHVVLIPRHSGVDLKPLAAKGPTFTQHLTRSLGQRRRQKDEA